MENDKKYSKNFLVSVNNEFIDQMRENMLSIFDWEYSPEGDDYWSDIRSKLYKIKKARENYLQKLIKKDACNCTKEEHERFSKLSPEMQEAEQALRGCNTEVK